MRHTLKSFVICLMVVALTLQPAGACHWFRGHWGGGHWGGGHWGGHNWGGHRFASWGPGYYYGTMGYGGCCGGEPVAYWSYYGGCGGCGSYDSDSWGCGSCAGEVVDGVMVEPQFDRAPAAPSDNRARSRSLPPARSQRPERVDRRDPAPTLPAPPEDTFAPRSDPSPPTPMPTQPLPPAETQDDDDLFGAPAGQPADEPDDLFNGTEAATPPATLPATPAPPTQPVPATPPATEAEEPDDLFGAPAEMPAETPAEPAEPAAPAQPTEQPADDAFNFFGTEAETAAPAASETPAANETPAATEAPADAQTPAASETPAATEESATEETPVEDKAAEEDADIFDFGSTRTVLGEPGGLASEDMRVWIDNTGSYSCRGRLVRFLDDRVQLLKDNGRITTVPLYRLSASDLEFVHRQASAQHAEALQTAQR